MRLVIQEQDATVRVELLLKRFPRKDTVLRTADWVALRIKTATWRKIEDHRMRALIEGDAGLREDDHRKFKEPTIANQSCYENPIHCLAASCLGAGRC